MGRGKEESKKRIRMRPVSLGGSCERERFYLRIPFTSWEISLDRQELQKLRGECSTQTVAGRTERPAQMV